MMPRRLTKREFDDEVYKLWFGRLCTFGLLQARKIVYAAYKELRRQDEERKAKSKRRDKKQDTQGI